MAIVASPAVPRHPAPRTARPRPVHPIAGARGIGDGFYEIAVQPGAVAADVVAALDAIPFDAAFVEVYDDTDTVLIFQHSRHTAAAACPATPARREPVAG